MKTTEEIIDQLLAKAARHAARSLTEDREGHRNSGTWEHGAACVLYAQAFDLAWDLSDWRNPGWPDFDTWLKWLGDGLDEIEARRRALADVGVAGHA